jgi:two-component system repressor protein LuxO
LDCAAISGAAVERELFGEIPRGGSVGWLHSGLIERANGGILFLDEISELDYAAQSLFLRFLESGTFRALGSDTDTEANVRVIAATNRDPLEEVRAGRLREDLYYRLQVFPVRLPALRERLDDLPLLVSTILEPLLARTKKTLNPLSEGVLRRLSAYAWPGNIRQLENLLQWVVIMLVGNDVTVEIIDRAIVQFDNSTERAAPTKSTPVDNTPKHNEIRPLWLVEREAIEAAVEASDGNVNRAATLLEVAPSTIYRKMQAWTDDKNEQ